MVGQLLTYIATNADGVRFVYVADMDEDGDMDVLSASSVDNTIAWYENSNGDGASWNKERVMIQQTVNNTHPSMQQIWTGMEIRILLLLIQPIKKSF